MILFCDIERPLWSAPMRWFNRFFAKHVMAAASSQNVETEAVGGINKVFHYAYQLRAQAKKLKNSHRGVYYVGKWVLIVGLVWLLFFR